MSHSHGQYGTPEYKIWSLMIQRCNNPKRSQYRFYGGRGIRVCERWLKPEGFLADMGPRPGPGFSVDRYPDKEGNYEPGNCRWATRLEQANNSRWNRHLTLNGEVKTMAEWSRATGIKLATIHARLKKGWTEHRALTERVRGN
jgi:hypothetical protein